MSSEISETRTKILEATKRLMEEGNGQNVRMSDIAKETKISRQAIYLHFISRTDLLVETTHYIDEIRGLDQRLERYRAARRGAEMLDEFVDFWGHYIPQIYRLAKVLMALRETDEAARAAWNDRMASVRSGCREIIEALARDQMLAPTFAPDEAVDLLWTMLSINTWEHLTIERGWPAARYINRMKLLLRRTFVTGSAGKQHQAKN